MFRVDVRGSELAYTDRGNRSPLLLIHAFPFDHTMWAPQIEAFAKVRRVVAPDLAGFGTSAHGGRPSMDEHADDLADLLDHLRIETAVVCGLSMGGYVALAMWRRHSERFAALVLADTRSSADPPEIARKRRHTADGLPTTGMSELAAEMPARVLSGRAPSELVQDVRDTISRQPVEGVAAALRAMADRPDATGDLQSIDVPSLVLVGTADTVITPDEPGDLADGIPGALLNEVPGAGHISNLEEPGAFNAALRAFLESVDAEMGVA